MNLKERSLEVSLQALSNLKKKDDNYTIDPLTALMIAEVLIKVLKFILEWYSMNKVNALKSTKSMNFLKKLILQRVVKKHTKNASDAKIALDAICEMVYSSSDEDKEQLLNLVSLEK